MTEEKKDMLENVFERQEKFMRKLVENDKMPEYPVDLASKMGQRMIKEMIFNMIEELAEASFTLKNRMHRLTDERELDFDHFREELGDALAFFVEVCIMSGISSKDLFDEYCKKNAIVSKRLDEGY